jgi:hypothetical protein
MHTKNLSGITYTLLGLSPIGYPQYSAFIILVNPDIIAMFWNQFQSLRGISQHMRMQRPRLHDVLCDLTLWR